MMIVENIGRGFVEGAGIDSLLWVLSRKIPELAQPSPIKIPFYDPKGIHYDDLIALGVSLGVIGFGAIKKDMEIIAEGASMVIGNVVISKFQP